MRVVVALEPVVGPPSRVSQRAAGERAAASALRRLDPLAPLGAVVRAPSGRPSFADSRHRLSVSHSGSMAVAACATEAVGVDVERVRHLRGLTALATRTLSPPAAARVDAAEPAVRPIVFLAEWTALEALCKAHGATMASFLGREVAPPWRVHHFELPGPYLVAVVADRPVCLDLVWIPEAGQMEAAR